MADTSLTTRIILRNDFTNNWDASNSSIRSKLLKGEVGIEFVTDSLGNPTGQVRMKIGDGVSSWNDLPYFGDTSPQIFEITLPYGANHLDAINQFVTLHSYDLYGGEIAIIKQGIIPNEVNTHYQYTAYIYEIVDNVKVWKAFDGNYDASNVYFPKDILITTDTGYITTKNGQAYIPSKGKNLLEVFESIYSKEEYPLITQPEIILEYDEDEDQDGFVTSYGSFEVGTSVSPMWDAHLNPGKYSFGPATGITASTWEITDSLGNRSSNSLGSFPKFQLKDNTNYYLTIKANYTAGSIPVTNKGTPCPNYQIQSGQTSLNTLTHKITSYRNMFYGAFSTPIELNGSSIRSNCTPTKDNEIKINIPKGTTQVVIALYNKQLKKVFDSEAFGKNIFSPSTFKLISSNTSIPGAENYPGVPYNVYVYSPDVALNATEYICVLN